MSNSLWSQRAHQDSQSFTISWSLLRFLSIESVMLSNCLNLCRSLLLPSVFPSIRIFSIELTLRISWPKYWSFSFSISPSNEYSDLLFLRFNWFNLLVVQGTVKRVVHQHHSSETPIPWPSVFSMVHFSHPYMSTGKTIAWTIRIFVSQVMSLISNTLSRFVIGFLPMSKRLL